MLHYELGDSGLSEVRFGISPLCEMGLSLRTIREPNRFPLQLPWLSRTRRSWENLDLEVLQGLVGDKLWTPDFLSPVPHSPLGRIEDELEVLSEIDPSEFVQQLVRIHGEVPLVFDCSPDRAIERMMLALREYWEVCFSPYWPRMRTILEADITYRGRVMAQQGIAEMLNSITATVSMTSSRLTVMRSSLPGEDIARVNEQGITLVPTMFTRQASVPVDPHEAPIILYPARGQGAMWETERVVNPQAVAEVLGKTRASLLTALTSPASSTELGIRFDVSTSAVNQHLRALRDVGLVTSTRYGRSVLYFRSSLGSALLGIDTKDY